MIARVRSNRVFYQSPPPIKDLAQKRGCPKKYGLRFSLAESDTWHECDETTQFAHTTRKGRQLKVMIQTWHADVDQRNSAAKNVSSSVHSSED